MNASLQALQAYGAAAQLRDPRQAERQVLAHVTARLAAAAASGDFARLAAALSENRRLWTRLAADVAGAGNGLPQELRARLFWLAEFTRAHSSRVLKGEAEAGPLLEINAAVMRGLAPPGAQAPGPDAANLPGAPTPAVAP